MTKRGARPQRRLSRVIVFGRRVCLDRALSLITEVIDCCPPMLKVQEKQRIVLSVLRGECRVAEVARRNRCAETSVAKRRDQFVQGGLAAREDAARPARRRANVASMQP
jgi:hypothetical protein